ncbi:MAG: hypothetical protein ACI8XC_003870 [Gammaproteobacteria bacterium]|jgi:hypothetical protein
MTIGPRYDILFEPIKIGLVTSPSRFYLVPHCNGMGRIGWWCWWIYNWRYREVPYPMDT